MSDDICLESCSPITGSGNASLASEAVGRLLSVVSGLDQGLCILTKYFTIDLHPQKKNDTFLKDPKMWVLPRWKERTNSHKLSSDLVRHTDKKTQIPTWMYTHVQYNKNVCIHIYMFIGLHIVL